ncbi:MAG: hypothetical protein IKO48_07305 [Elusimicrobia bacterium]|nr:hypothetical protein [Elusimicrobiota bacterium]
MKKFIEIKQLRYVTKEKYPAPYEYEMLADDRPRIVTEEVITKQIIPIDTIKKVFCQEPTELLIRDEKEGLIYIKVKNSYEDIKSKMGDLLC